MNELQQKIERLISQKAINIGTNQTGRARHRGSKILPLSKAQEPRIGDYCRSIVVGKDESKKELILHLTYLVEEEQSIYINHLKCKGYIRDYDLKEEYSIFTYLGNFKSTTLGTEIFAQVRSIVNRDEQKLYEMTLKCKKASQNSHFNPGIVRDQVEIAERDWKIYSKYGCFSGSFLAQYEQNFANPGLFHRYSKDLKLKENESLNQDSLVPYLQGLSLDYQRLLSSMKQSSWTDKHFMEGLKCLKSNRPDLALEHLTLAKSFDKKSSKIYIARGCALANLNNLSDGLKEIKEALRLSPNNKEALGYLDKIRKEMKGKEGKDQEMQIEPVDEGAKKIRLNNNMEPVRKR